MKNIFILITFIVNLYSFDIAPAWYPNTNKNLVIKYADADDLY